MKRKTILFTSLSLLLGLLVSCGGDVNTSLPTSTGSSSNSQTTSQSTSLGSSSEGNINSSSEGTSSSVTKDSTNTPVSSEDPHTSDDTPVSSDTQVSSTGGQTTSENPESSDSTGGGSSSETVRTVTSLAFDNWPKKEYNKGEDFTLKTKDGNYDSTLKVTYDDNSTATVTVTMEMVVEEPNMNQIGQQTVTIQYGGKEITYEITITMPKIEEPVFSFTYQSGDETKKLESGNTFYDDAIPEFKVTIVADGVEFEEGVDYKVVYTQNEAPLDKAPTTPGTYDVRITTLAGSSKVVEGKSEHRWYVIQKAPTADQIKVHLVLDVAEYAYTGESVDVKWHFANEQNEKVEIDQSKYTFYYSSAKDSNYEESLKQTEAPAGIQYQDTWYSVVISMTNEKYIIDGDSHLSFHIKDNPKVDETQTLVDFVLESQEYEYTGKPVEVKWHFVKVLGDDQTEPITLQPEDYTITYSSDTDDPDYKTAKAEAPSGIKGKSKTWYGFKVTVTNSKYVMNGGENNAKSIPFHIDDKSLEPTINFSIEPNHVFKVGEDTKITVTVEPNSIQFSTYYSSATVSGYEDGKKNQTPPTEIGSYSFCIDTVAHDGYPAVHKWVNFSISAAS